MVVKFPCVVGSKYLIHLPTLILGDTLRAFKNKLRRKTGLPQFATEIYPKVRGMVAAP